MGLSLRSWALAALAVGAAVLLWYVMFADDRQRAQEACAERGGHVVIQSDAQSIGQFCIMPNGEQTPL